MLLSASVTDLQKLFNLCELKFSILDLPINVNKCHCMRIGPRFNATCKNIIVNNTNIEWVNSIKYLGITIKQGKNFQVCFNEAKRKFFSTVNSILGNLGHVNSPMVTLHLIMTQAVPHLTYGLNVLCLSKADLNSLSYAYNSVFAKLFKTNDTKIIHNCQFFLVIYVLKYFITSTC